MDKKHLMMNFIKIVNDRGLMTKFIRNIFDYNNFYDYNYIFRMIERDNEIVIDIYDNVSDNRFNRYIFSFLHSDIDKRIVKEGDVYVNYISILNTCDSDNKLLKLAYLFKIDDSKMIEYGNSFLDNEFIEILFEIIK